MCGALPDLSEILASRWARTGRTQKDGDPQDVCTRCRVIGHEQRATVDDLGNATRRGTVLGMLLVRPRLHNPGYLRGYAIWEGGYVCLFKEVEGEASRGLDSGLDIANTTAVGARL